MAFRYTEMRVFARFSTYTLCDLRRRTVDWACAWMFSAAGHELQESQNESDSRDVLSWEALNIHHQFLKRLAPGNRGSSSPAMNPQGARAEKMAY
jgi:hypothetical protein